MKTYFRNIVNNRFWSLGSWVLSLESEVWSLNPLHWLPSRFVFIQLKNIKFYVLRGCWCFSKSNHHPHLFWRNGDTFSMLNGKLIEKHSELHMWDRDMAPLLASEFRSVIFWKWDCSSHSVHWQRLILLSALFGKHRNSIMQYEWKANMFGIHGV